MPSRRQAKLADASVVEKEHAWQKDTDKRRGPDDPRIIKALSLSLVLTVRCQAPCEHLSHSEVSRGAQLSFKAGGFVVANHGTLPGFDEVRSRAQVLAASHSWPTFLFYYILRCQTAFRGHILNLNTDSKCRYAYKYDSRKLFTPIVYTIYGIGCEVGIRFVVSYSAVKRKVKLLTWARSQRHMLSSLKL